jgi:tetratricopeptide (TPR) repeat protein
MRYLVALVVGLLAIPSLAFAATALSDDTPGSAGSTTTTTTAIAAEDLIRACGVEGRYLVELEVAGTIDEIQLAALTALRPICEQASLPLPPAPTGQGGAIVETVPVAGTSLPGPAPQPAADTTTTTVVEEEYRQEALMARAAAVAAIEKAIATDGNPDEINEAIGLVEAGDVAYGAGDYDAAEERYDQAEDSALDAGSDRGRYHEDEDDEHDDDEDDYDDDDEDDD